MIESTSTPRAVSELRRFSRFYTGFVDALSDRMLKSEFSLPQARVLHEIATGPKNTQAADMARALRMDAGQLSRILSGLETAGLIERAAQKANAKRLNITLTETGKVEFTQLDRRSSEQTAAALEKLTGSDRTRVVRAMRLITRLLGARPHPAVPVDLRPLEPGDMGWVIWRQSVLYAGEYGWNAEYEALVLQILADFTKAHDPKRETGWIAEIDGEPVGAVFLVKKDKTTAQLRLLHVEGAARGRGIGRALVEECLSFARAAGYRRIELWTNDVLRSARRIYIHAGFRLIEETAHHSFGHDLIGQTWGRDL
ncbi:helix-turn-helix domain-containing GNAT family N-acetyltransferase [Pseudooceanicola sp.]|uniref:bifunctional helix-turn-helix transcriptional regulator/GNAT family N-acetyltransferase n=1 Tax=Pseudooceanicola sp. TaxID=1914328 RepID=UPI00262CFAC1|nr:helix-turn-helix domain-containing GNAT family N-acetyltransferase [Pseudooceanicola sp.]MDF1854513.1 helix-turn-helix domain-containing GNAT family N-acetyltransferase [Pseudooceanicola sp.]